MARLTQADLRGLLAFLRTCETLSDVESLRAGMLPGLRRLIRCDHVAYNEVDLASGEPFWIIHPRDSEARADAEAFVRWLPQHPIVHHHATHAGGKAVQLADFLSRRELHRLELYQDFFKPLGIEHQLAITIPAPGGVLLGLPFNRADRPYSERERLLLDMLRPHLAQLYRRGLERAEVRRALETLDAAAERAGRAVMLVGPGDAVQLSGGRAATSLDAYFPAERPRAGRLPRTVAAWVRSQRRRLNRVGDAPAIGMPLIAVRNGARLRVSFLPAVAADEPDALVVEERRAELAPDGLRALGLTRREADVLCCADRGLASADIGRELGISPRTVTKHFERIHAKLDVPTRTAALARARQAV